MNLKPNRFHRGAAALLLLVAGFSSLFGQTTTGTLVGNITDVSGAAVPNAAVEAVNTATNVKSPATATSNGDYRFGNLPAGTYNVTATAPGFTTATRRGVLVTLSTVSTENITMQVGSVATTVDVSESATTIDTTTATISTNFDTTLARDLPVSTIGLGVLNLSLLGSGVASSGGVGAGTGPSVGGQRPRNNNFTIEGVDNNNKGVTGPLAYVPNDAVDSFTLLQNQVTAEFGHSSGGQFNTIVKSGTNSVHGSLYEYLQNRNLNAINQTLANQGVYTNSRYDQNRLGATIGGPILRNKLFYFGNFEYNPLGQAATPGTPVTAPTAAGYAVLNGIPGINPTNLKIFQQYVSPAPVADPAKTIKVGSVSVPAGTLPVVAPNFSNSYAAVASVDYTLSEKDQLRGRYIYNKTDAIDTAPVLAAFFVTNSTKWYIGTLSEFHNFTPNLTNELRLGFNRYNNPVNAGNFQFPGLDAFPDLHISDLNLQIGPDPNAPQTAIQNTYQVVDNVSWIRGRHTFKFGFDGRKLISPQTFTQRGRGDYEYTTLSVYLLDRTPDDLAQRSVGAPVYYGDQTQLYGYVNDSWKVRPNFTVNLGLRYEFTSVPFGERSQILNNYASVPGVLSFNVPQPQYKNFAPRVGIAYSPGTSGNTSIRAGFGMSYDVIYDNVGLLSLPPQLSQTVDVTDDGTPGASQPNFLKNGGIKPNASAGSLSVADARAGTSGYVPDQKLPYSIQWNFGVQHIFAKNYTFEARYLGTRGVHLDVQTRINRIGKTTPSFSLPTYFTMPAQATLDALPITLAQIQARSSYDPRFAAAGFNGSNIVEDSPIGRSSYHGLALQLNRRFNNGLQFIGAYTWSHLIDDSTADFFSTVLSPRRPQQFENQRAELATSALDRRQRFTMTVVYDVPWFKQGNWFLRNAVGNLEIAPIYTYESPELATVQSQLDSNLNGDAFTDRTFINIAGSPGTGSTVTALKNSAGATVAYVANNPNARYVIAGAGTFPNAGRNTLAGRPIDNLDVNFLKRFSYKERAKVEFSAQFLNSLNHPQFVPGLLNQINSTSQTGGGVRNYLTPGKANFNNPEATFSSNPRTIQLALKLIF
ncbi:MAG: carboxypeptidase regulatory-like domain-containing protein [Acidobacteriota bacterium]|nr:carboxypeptidase regulatory-like domain-containing protein [Acidobacteriota bacterium]